MFACESTTSAVIPVVPASIERTAALVTFEQYEFVLPYGSDMTFSIVALLDGGVPGVPGPAWGVAVASKFLAAGAVVPGARAGVGAVATQALANVRYLPDGLAALAEGDSATDVLTALTSADASAGQRQAGVVDAVGRSATFTGGECFAWAGGVSGDGYAIQGNILTGPEVVQAMETAWHSGSGPLADRLVAALLAGDRAGGDSRGRQSAAVLVVAEAAGYGGGNDVAVDLRVDDHADPVVELRRLLDVHTLLFGRPEQTLPLDAETSRRLRAALDALGFPDPDLQVALNAAAGIENLEERMVPDAVDVLVLEHLERLAAAGSRHGDDSDYMPR
jgi:uncharacterized Ntn-hydrolase superfamily protein